MSDLKITAASAEDFAVAVEWAASEGWNPGLDDLPVFHGTDPSGFLIGKRDGEPVSCLSVVRYGETYGFLGFYIVRADQRGTGTGMAIWVAGMDTLAGRTVGLDGVVDQQENYRKSGFALAGRNIRLTGVPVIGSGVIPARNIHPVSSSDLPALLAYDRRFFGVAREKFTRPWVLPDEKTRRTALVAQSGGEIAGYGVVRQCRTGYKIGPLFACDEGTATDLFVGLCQTIEPGADVSLDIPQGNAAAVRLAGRFGLEPVFETARMYRGPAPDLPVGETYGITTFELG